MQPQGGVKMGRHRRIPNTDISMQGNGPRVGRGLRNVRGLRDIPQRIPEGRKGGKVDGRVLRVQQGLAVPVYDD